MSVERRKAVRDLHARHQKLLDALQVIAPVAQRLDLTARQQQEDAKTLLEATRRAVSAARTALREERS